MLKIPLGNHLSREKSVMFFGFVSAVQNNRLSNWYSAFCTATYNTSLLVTLHRGPPWWENLTTPLVSQCHLQKSLLLPR